MALFSTCQDVVQASRSSEFVTGASVLAAVEALTGVFCLFVGLRYGSKEAQLPRYAHFMAWAALAGAFVWFTVLKRIGFDREIQLATDCLTKNALKAQSAVWFAVFAMFRPISVILFSIGKSVPLLRLFDICNISHGSKRRKITRATRRAVAAMFTINIVAITISGWWNVATRIKLFNMYSNDAKLLCETTATQAFEDATAAVSYESSLADRLFGVSAICFSVLNVCVFFMYLIAIVKTRRTMAALLRSVAAQAQIDDDGASATSRQGSIHKFNSLKSFIYRTYAMMFVLFIALIYRTLHTAMIGVGMTVGSKPGCDGRCASCQNPSYVLAAIMQFSTANLVSMGMLDEVFSTLFGIWGMLPNDRLQSSKPAGNKEVSHHSLHIVQGSSLL